MVKNYEICQLQDLPDGSSRGFTLDLDTDHWEIFIIRKGNQIYGYRNCCPHTGVNLDWKPDQFLDSTGDFIQCSTHGAKFQVNDGFCVYGPCTGRSLTPVILEVEDGQIILNLKG